MSHEVDGLTLVTSVSNGLTFYMSFSFIRNKKI